MENIWNIAVLCSLVNFVMEFHNKTRTAKAIRPPVTGIKGDQGFVMESHNIFRVG